MFRAPFLLLLPLVLASCGQGPAEGRARPGPALAEGPGARLGDPAVAAAINAPIMVDPGLGQSSNADAIRPPGRPDPVSVPPDDLGAPADPASRR